MRKIVINKCYGGFGLSNEASARYKDLSWIPPEDFFSYYDIQRDDPILIKVIEEIGLEKSSGKFVMKYKKKPNLFRRKLLKVLGVDWKII